MSIFNMLTASECERQAEMTTQWSPFDINLMLHHHCSTGRFPQEDAPIYAERMDALIARGLLSFSDEDKAYRSTALGAALVKMWRETPIPAVRFVDPRFEATS